MLTYDTMNTKTCPICGAVPNIILETKFSADGRNEAYYKASIECPHCLLMEVESEYKYLDSEAAIKDAISIWKSEHARVQRTLKDTYPKIKFC